MLRSGLTTVKRSTHRLNLMIQLVRQFHGTEGCSRCVTTLVLPGVGDVGQQPQPGPCGGRAGGLWPFSEPWSYIVARRDHATVAGAPRTEADWIWNNPISSAVVPGRSSGVRGPRTRVAFTSGVVRQRVSYWPHAYLRKLIISPHYKHAIIWRMNTVSQQSLRLHRCSEIISELLCVAEKEDWSSLRSDWRSAIRLS